jgi:hypothetical protein
VEKYSMIPLFLCGIGLGTHAWASEPPPTSAWGKMYAQAMVISGTSTEQVIALKSGDVVRFQNTNYDWCGEENSGVKILSGFGALLELNPVVVSKPMSGNGAYAAILPINDSSFFVAANDSVKIKVLKTSHEILKQDCGE